MTGSATAFVPAAARAVARGAARVSAGAVAPVVAARVALPEEQGPSGPPGRDGVGLNLAFPFTIPALSWLLAHGLDRFPSVTIVDTAGDMVLADVTYLDANTIQIAFGSPSAGTAYLN